MTENRKRIVRNAIVSARMEGLTVTKQTQQDCIRYLDGKMDTETLVREALHRCREEKGMIRG